MKLLIVVSSLDLTQPFSATPAWWQLLKALYEEGHEVIAAPYQGPPIESLWWRAEDNPAKFFGDSFLLARNTIKRLLPQPQVQQTFAEQAAVEAEESASDKLIRQTAQNIVAPLWERHLDKILTKEPDIDAVIFLTIPLNQLVGVPQALQDKHDVPVFYFDGDVPASLPNMRGFASGFRIYQGADLSEYTAFISNSKGGEALLKDLGARAAHTVWYGADPDVFAPMDVPQQDLDVMFFGHGREYRGEWIDAMIQAPSNALPDAKFAVRGKNLGDIGKTRQLPYLSFAKLREYVNRSKVNLVITRGAHATLYGSASSRPFELAGMRACMLANPYNGLEEWFEPEKEIIILEDPAQATERIRYLLAHAAVRETMAQAARERLLKEHTFRHRVRDLEAILQQYL